MCNIPNFVQISSVLVLRSTAPTGLLLSSRPEKGLLSDIRAKCRHRKMDISAGRRASAHAPIMQSTIWKRERRLQAWHVATKQPWS